MVRMRLLLGLGVVTLCAGCASSAPVIAQAPVPSAPATACQADEFRHFDFWIGDWDVMVADGKKAGDNSIKPIHGGCALQESYQSAGGYRGQSFNIYDATRQLWHQTWVDNTGLLLTIEGGLRDGSMVMTGTRARQTPQGEVLDRISWTPNEDGTVRQVWEVSADEGGSWRVIFDGTYRRKTAS